MGRTSSWLQLRALRLARRQALGLGGADDQALPGASRGVELGGSVQRGCGVTGTAPPSSSRLSAN